MKIALRCEKCRNQFMQGEEDLCLEFDFYEKKITFVCQTCKHENVLDLGGWQKQQKHSPLPKMKLM